MSRVQTTIWQALAGLTIGLSLWYLHWRWTESLNPEAPLFSILVAVAESALFVGSLLFFYDIWEEGDTPRQAAPTNRCDCGLDDDGSIIVDILITTFDEATDIVGPTIRDAQNLSIPDGVEARIAVLDDGARVEIAKLCQQLGVRYLTRDHNRGFKAGNLQNALMQTQGDFIVICDADTRLFPSFLQNTLGYFRDPRVSWVQTPHWFYDLPVGATWRAAIARRLGRPFAPLARILGLITGKERIGADPFSSNPTVFFDIIQRRRNRNSASFCCGAGSIHRREAVFADALAHLGDRARHLVDGDRARPNRAALRVVGLEPFRYHVSEDILTSIHHHNRGWISVYHPQVEARMLSPWSVKAWATQKLKYAGGSYDIMIRTRSIFRSGMPMRTRLHYCATFWSYLSALWMPILLFAPVFSLLTGLSPVRAISAEFFWHLVPVLLANEAAILVGCKGYDTHAGRAMSIGTLAIQIRALVLVILGERPRFPTTPKRPRRRREWRHARFAIATLCIMAISAVAGFAFTMMGWPGFSVPLLIVNCFWLIWNGMALIQIVQMCLWSPEDALTDQIPDDHQSSLQDRGPNVRTA